jgi:hypothetical protein
MGRGQTVGQDQMNWILLFFLFLVLAQLILLRAILKDWK